MLNIKSVTERVEDAKIVDEKLNGETYYLIEFTHPDDRCKCRWFGSYDREQCERWLKEYFPKVT